MDERTPQRLTPLQKFLLVILAVLAFLAFYWMTVDALDWQWERYEEEAAEFRESLAEQGISWPASQPEEEWRDGAPTEERIGRTRIRPPKGHQLALPQNR